MKKILIALFCVFFVSLFASVAFASSDVDQVVTNNSVNQDIFISVDLGRDYDFNCNESVIDNGSVITDEPVVDSDLSCKNTSSELNSASMVDSNVSSSAKSGDVSSNRSAYVANISKKMNMTIEELWNFIDKEPCPWVKLNMPLKEYMFFITYLHMELVKERSQKKISENKTVKNKTGPQLNIKGPNLYNIDPKGPDFKKLYDAARNIKGPKANNQKDKYVDTVFKFAVVFLQHPEWYIVDYLAYVCKFYDDEGYLCSLIADAHNFALRNYGGPGHMAVNEEIAPLTVYTYMRIYWIV